VIRFENDAGKAITSILEEIEAPSAAFRGRKKDGKRIYVIRHPKTSGNSHLS
jgi:hypothetical protein